MGWWWYGKPVETSNEQSAAVVPVGVVVTLPTVTATWEAAYTAAVVPLLVAVTLPGVTAQARVFQAAWAARTQHLLGGGCD